MLLKETQQEIILGKFLGRREGRSPAQGKGKNSRVGLIVGVILVAILVAFLYFSYGPQSSDTGDNRVLVSWRMKFSIFDIGIRQNLTLPALVGAAGGLWFDHTLDYLGPPGFAPLSTRDGSGTLYIEFYIDPNVCPPSCPVFKFGNLFNIWGETLNSTCVGTGSRGVYCAGRADEPRIRFVDTNANNLWEGNEPVLYDSDNNWSYEPGDVIVFGSAPSLGTVLKDDARIHYIDENNYGFWDPGETIVYDSNENAAYDKADPRITFVDANNNGLWDSDEVLIYDSDSSLSYDGADILIVGSSPPLGTALKRVEPRVRYADYDDSNNWNSTEPVIYDGNNNGLFDQDDQRIAGPVPEVGTSLRGEPVIAGAAPSSLILLIRPPAFMSDGSEERCLDSNVNLSNGKDWLIVIWSVLSVGNCDPGQL